MSRLSKLQDHLCALLVQDAELFNEGDWEALKLVRLAIDDTHDQIDEYYLLLNELEHNK